MFIIYIYIFLFSYGPNGMAGPKQRREPRGSKVGLGIQSSKTVAVIIAADIQTPALTYFPSIFVWCLMYF